MTLTQQRWWAPSQPGIGPDSFDLSLLEPGEDGPKDLGQAFMALHRVGAAACEAVATQPIPDETTLAWALATARQEMAPAASEIVSKSVGGDVNYGNLLLRDVLDDAEATALSLWRSCIAAKIPAPIAAQRVGMVYGLPPSEIMPFQKMATDLKTNPTALTDTADRALFGYLAKLVEEEGVDHKINISKARPRPQRAGRPAWETEPRDESGQWTAEEAEVPVEEPVAPPRPTRGVRGVRGTRGKRGVRPESPAPRGEMQGASMRGSEMRGSEMQKMAMAFAQMGTSPMVTEGENRSGKPRNPGKPTAAYPDAPTYDTPVNKTLAVVMPTGEWGAFTAASDQEGENGRLFRAGRLEDYAGPAEPYQEENGDPGKEHNRNVRQAANKVKAQMKEGGYEQVRTLHIDGFIDNEPELLAEKIKFLQGQGIEEGHVIREELKWVDQAVDYDRGYWLVWAPQSDRHRPSDRLYPSITEVRVSSRGLMGENMAPEGSPEDWRLDKNQSMTTFSTLSGRSQLRFWDPNLRVFRNRVSVERSDELETPPEPGGRVKKAMTPRRFAELAQQGRVHRDALGEFAADEEEEPEPVIEAPARPERGVRGKRGQRGRRGLRAMATQGMQQAEMQGSEMRGAEMAGASMQMSPMRQAEMVKAGWAADDSADPYRGGYGQLKLPTGGNFTAVPIEEMKPAGVPSLGWQYHAKRPGERFREWLHQLGEVGPTHAIGDAFSHHLDKQNIWRSGQVWVLNNDLSFNNVTPEDVDKVANAVWAEFERNPDFSAMRSRLTINPDGTVNYRIYGNAKNLSTRDVIHWRTASSEDIRDGYKLVPMTSGRFQTVKSIRSFLFDQWKYAESLGVPHNTEKLANPIVRVWGAEAD